MAKKIDYMPAQDAAIAIAGGQIVLTQVLPKVTFLADLLAKLPADVMGVSVPLLVAGATVLVTVKHFMK